MFSSRVFVREEGYIVQNMNSDDTVVRCSRKSGNPYSVRNSISDTYSETRRYRKERLDSHLRVTPGIQSSTINTPIIARKSISTVNSPLLNQQHALKKKQHTTSSLARTNPAQQSRKNSFPLCSQCGFLPLVLPPRDLANINSEGCIRA